MAAAKDSEFPEAQEVDKEVVMDEGNKESLLLMERIGSGDESEHDEGDGKYLKGGNANSSSVEKGKRKLR